MIKPVAHAKFERVDELEPQRAGLQQVRLSLLAPERALLPAGTPAGLVLDLYGSVLSEAVIAERVTEMLVTYAQVTGDRFRVFDVPAERLWSMDIGWHRDVAIDGLRRMGSRLDAVGLNFAERPVGAMAKVVAVFTEAVSKQRVFAQFGALSTCDTLYAWWRDEVCATLGVVV